MLVSTIPTPLSLRYREIALQAWSEVILPHIEDHYPHLVDAIFVAIGSSVAYGLADKYSDIDIVLILPADVYNANGKEWTNWTYGSLELAIFSKRMQVETNVKVSTWQREGVGILFNGDGSWDEFYGHHHWVTNLIPIHDPSNQMKTIRESVTQMPVSVADRAAEQCIGELADLHNTFKMLDTPIHERFVGLLSYSIATRTLPFLYHRQRVSPPFHKWLWPLAKSLGGDAEKVLQQLRAMLESQADGMISFHEDLIEGNVKIIPSREYLLPTGISLPPSTVEQALASIQWHLDERGCYQMVRAHARGFHESALQYMCATRCLLIKGAILLETSQIACGEQVAGMWEQIQGRIPGLENCLWPKESEDAFEQTLHGINILRRRFAEKQALPQLYLDRPLWSPPSYELACILEEL
ncbi:MAG: hypothetical protein ACYC27_09225 [Armatimonadota bacterium]